MCLIKKSYFKKLDKYYEDELIKPKNNNEIHDKLYNKLIIKIQELDKNKHREDIIKVLASEDYVEENTIRWNENNNLFAFNNKILKKVNLLRN